MSYDKLTHQHLEHGASHEAFSRLQHGRDISEHGRLRISEAMRAAIDHVQRKEGLTLGMTGKHVDDAMHYLDTHYEGRHELLPKEREVIEQSFHTHFGIKPAPEV